MLFGPARKCLGYDGFDCDADLTGADHRRKRCPSCAANYKRCYTSDLCKEARRVSKHSKPRRCLGYPGHDCDVDLTEAHGGRRRCPGCYVENHRLLMQDRYLANRPAPVRISRSGEPDILPCARCNKWLPVEAFGWTSKKSGRRRSYCRPCESLGQMEWRKANPDREKAMQARANKRARERRRNLPPEDRIKYSLRISARRLGFDPDEIATHYSSHSGLCDICGRHPREVNRLRMRLCIDHDHKTGKFRGLLCTDCNLWIGLAQDDPKLLLAAVRYLLAARAD